MPPKIAILVLWRSFMSVLNIAHVDAQFALPTIAMFLWERGSRQQTGGHSRVGWRMYSGAKNGSSGTSTKIGRAHV